MPAKTPLARDKIDAPAACAVPFRPYCGGVVTRTRNVSEYMLVLALCLVFHSDGAGLRGKKGTLGKRSFRPLPSLAPDSGRDRPDSLYHACPL